jgi:dephospho-CoA kinase
MLAVGLAGGIGAGKSTVGGLLIERGALLIDADRIAREVVEPGGPAFDALVDRFGPGILTSDGTVDRPGLAAIVFRDPAALTDLNAITHPVIGQVMVERGAALRDSDRIVVFDVPLLRPGHRGLLSLEVVIVVDCPSAIALERLVEMRGMSRTEAEARIAAQPTREERLEGADEVIDNSSTLAHLTSEVDRVWATLVTRAVAKHPQV